MGIVVVEHLKDLSLERAVLCGCIVKPDEMNGLELSSSDFFDSYYGKLYRCLELMHGAGQPIDLKTLKAQLGSMGIPFRAAELKAIAAESATAAHTHEYAATIVKLAKHRQVIRLSDEMRAMASDVTNRVSEIANHARRYIHLLDVENSRQIGVANAMDHLLQVIEDETISRSIPTGYPTIDSAFGTLRSSELTVLGARPSTGKTTFALEIALHNAFKGRLVLYVSLEMSIQELASRIASMELGLDSRVLRNDKVAHDVRQLLRELKADKDNDTLKLWAPPSATVSHIESQARYRNAKGGLDLLIVDHLQLVKKADADQARYEHIGQVTADLKALAKELDIAVLCQSQLSRSEDKPKLSSLRESGDIEQNADNVWFLHKPHPTANVEFIVGKFRHGQTGELSGDSALRFAEGGRLVDQDKDPQQTEMF